MTMPSGLSEKDAGALREFVAAVRRALGPNLIELRLFGSKARGDDDPESDIDVLVVLKTASQADEDKVLDRAFRTSLGHDVVICPLLIEQSIVEHPVWRLSGLLDSVAREGIAL
jgi:predicted nucleotidyltransferase